MSAPIASTLIRLLRGAMCSSIALLAACERGEPAPRVAAFRFESCDQAGGEGVSLTEWIRLRFSDPVDPGTLRKETIRIVRLDANGEPKGPNVAGRFRVLGRGDVVAFAARVPLDASLEDGGFLPGSRYRVYVAGYPRPDGLRALDGRLLDESVHFEFRTVAPGQLQQLFSLADEGWPGDEFPHVPSLQQGLADEPRIYFWADSDTWLLVFDGALRPDSLSPGSVRLVREPHPSELARFQAPPSEWPADELIPVAQRLLRAEEAVRRLEQDELPLASRLRFDPRWLTDGCVLELRPQFVEPPKPDASYFLAFELATPIERRSPDGYLYPAGLRGYAGQGLLSGQHLLIATLRERPARTRELSYDFLPGEQLFAEDDELGLPIADGVLQTHAGAAAALLAREGGTAMHGAFPTGVTIELEEPLSPIEARAGRHYERISVPTGSTLHLGSAASAILRAQGRCSVQGSVYVEPPVGESSAPLEAEALGGFERTLTQLQLLGLPHVAFVSSGELHWDGPLDAPGRIVLLASSNRLRFGSTTTIRAAALWIFTPSQVAGTSVGIDSFGVDRERLPERLWIGDGAFEYAPELLPRVPLHFRVVSASVPFGDLRRVFEPSALARLALSSGSEADVRSFIQVGEGPRAWEGIARYLRAGLPLSLPAALRARVGLEIRLMPRSSADRAPARVDRFEVLLR